MWCNVARNEKKKKKEYPLHGGHLEIPRVKTQILSKESINQNWNFHKDKWEWGGVGRSKIKHPPWEGLDIFYNNVKVASCPPPTWLYVCFHFCVTYCLHKVLSVTPYVKC